MKNEYTIRNRLLELLIDSNFYEYEKQVDYLLKNGVIVQPCEIYKDVFFIIDGVIERCTVEGIYYTRRKNYVRLRPYHQEYWGNWSKYYTPSLRSFGKTIFNTREDAEKSLKGVKNK